MAFARFTRSTDSDGAIVYTQADTGTVTLAAGSRDFIVANSLGTGIRYDAVASTFEARNQFLDAGEFRIHTTNVAGPVDLDVFPVHETAAILRVNDTDPIEDRTVFLGNV